MKTLTLLLLLLLLLVSPFAATPATTRPQFFNCFQYGYGGGGNNTSLGHSRYAGPSNIIDIYANSTYYSVNAYYWTSEFASTGGDFYGETAYVPACSAMAPPQHCDATFTSPTNSEFACGTGTMSVFTARGQDRVWTNYDPYGCEPSCSNAGTEVQVSLEHLCNWP